MTIPQNITKEHLLKAISKIDNEGIPKDGDSQYYDVVYNGKKYPPKLIVSYANYFANGITLDRNTFSGGLGTECFKLLEANEFTIRNKLVAYYVLGASWLDNENDPDQTERFIENGIWENGYDDKFLDIVNEVKIGDRVAIKSSYATRDGKSMLRVKAKGTVYENIGDGRTLKIIWDKSFKPFDLEGYGGYRNTIQKVSKDDIDVIFNRENKMTYYNELNKFLSQSESGDLGTANYLNNYQGLSVKVSFGKGNQARVPWIAFLNKSDSVQQGIYPVYLFYKEKKLLILAYGISETRTSIRKWDIINVKTIDEYFADNDLGRPERYGSSFVFKSYDTNKVLVEDEINDDLNNLILIYKATFNTSPIIPKPKISFNHIDFIQNINKIGLFFNETTILRFISSLLTKPFVILTGLSGSGKTKIAQAFAMWICESEKQYCIVPVGADWTNRDPLLGFPNALEKNNYVKPDNGVLDLIIEANKNRDNPYFLILDEMNLSHVERYFADFLSVMESKNTIALHSGENDLNGVPAQIGFPKNLFIIGTVNIDETTYMFSPKVLDRASVIEFRVTAIEMNYYLQSNSEIKLEYLKGIGKDMAESFVTLANDTNLEAKEKEEFNKTLMSFFAELKKTGAEFGYRSASEIIRFAAVSNKLDELWSSTEIMDAAIMQKLLPKVHGSRRKLESVLKTLGTLCLNEGHSFEEYLSKKDNSMEKYPISLEKIIRMHDNLLSNGFTSYAEA